ncbi:MAG: 23S rRNA (pseudouridine(1915)-N(3))-methyltransferase RlmH [Ruminococcus sp.]|nr:23S rRNA (pseudouridine(1915)-N(3))-methyltransferase RlmH [Ruminococcus sp.]MBQ9673730.1 23S rRNA (pseudouridine(1915)-N(3))-methyltransferase RlmH [Ruminococcus sp.]
MLTVNIICIGKLKEKYWVDAIKEYSKRLSAFCKFSVTELSEYKVNDNPNPKQIESVLAEEGKAILSKIKPTDFNITMCIEGKIISSEQLSALIDDVPLSGKSTVNFIIGGSWGLSEEVKQYSNYKLSMGKMTFPHQMARVMLAEQIYRAFQISTGGKYHK